VCATDYAGADCSTRVPSTSSVMSSLISAPHVHSLTRIGHTLVNCAAADHGGALLYLFGGYSVQRGLMNDLWTYNVTRADWQRLDATNGHQPSPRSDIIHSCQRSLVNWLTVCMLLTTSQPVCQIFPAQKENTACLSAGIMRHICIAYSDPRRAVYCRAWRKQLIWLSLGYI